MKRLNELKDGDVLCEWIAPSGKWRLRGYSDTFVWQALINGVWSDRPVMATGPEMIQAIVAAVSAETLKQLAQLRDHMAAGGFRDGTADSCAATFAKLLGSIIEEAPK